MGHAELIVNLVTDVPMHRKTMPNDIVCIYFKPRPYKERHLSLGGQPLMKTHFTQHL